jgi:hypothetical protein
MPLINYSRNFHWDNSKHYDDPTIKIILSANNDKVTFDFDETFVAFYFDGIWNHFRTKEALPNDICHKILGKYPETCEILIININHPDSMGVHDKFDIHCIKEVDEWNVFTSLRYLKGHFQHSLKWQGIINTRNWIQISTGKLPALPSDVPLSKENQGGIDLFDAYEYAPFPKKDYHVYSSPYGDGMQYIETPNTLDVLYDFLAPIIGQVFHIKGSIKSWIKCREELFISKLENKDFDTWEVATVTKKL